MASGVTTVQADWLTALGHNFRVYVIPEFKVVFVSVAKNACTTMKWVVADLAREDVASFTAGLKPYTADEHAVHNRNLFKLALYPDQVDPHMQADIHPNNGWFIFGIVRDPRVRLFSAWQDKLLMQDPAYRSMRDEPWYPQIPQTGDAIVADFARFVDTAHAEPEFRLRQDPHFMPQTEALVWGSVPYSRIYPIEKMAELRADLTRHVEPLGWAEPIRFRRSNDTPLRANAAVFAGDVRAKVEAMYASDFEVFGDLWDFDKIEGVPDWTPAAIREIQVRGALGRRLGDVRQIAWDYRRRAERAAKRAGKLERELADARREVARAAEERRRRPAALARRLARRVVRRLRSALR